MLARAALILALAVGCAHAAEKTRSQASFLRPLGESVVKPLEFNQRLLICNAYPSKSLVTVKHNGHAVFDDEERGVSFKQCRYSGGRVLGKDKLDFALEGAGTEGTFEVGDLPASDAILLLVLSHDARSPLIRFQSFAFPTNTGSKDAQLAVIDAFKGNSSAAPHLKMEDHAVAKDGKAVTKRVEQLNFDRVYAIQEGSYDAFVLDHKSGSGEQLETNTKTMVNMRTNQNYVVLRTGDDKDFPQSLVVFPEEKSASSPVARAWLAIAIAAVVAAMV